MRTFDPAVDDEDSLPSRRPLRVQDPVDPARTIPYLNFQPIQQFPGPFDARYLEFHQHLMTLSASARTANNPDMAAELPHSLPMQEAILPQQPASDSSSSDQGIPAAIPTTLNKGSQAPQLEQFHPVARAHSPITVQGYRLPQEGRPNSNVYSNLGSPPGQLDATNLQPQFAPYRTYQPVTNGDHGEDTRDMSPFIQSPDPNTQDTVDPRYPRTLAQKLYFESRGYRYPEPRDPYATISAAGPSAELNASTNSSNCQCGPGCNCVYCSAHPYNAATRERVQDLTQIMAMDNYWSSNHVNPPQSGYGDASTNGTNVEPVMEQVYPPRDQGSIPSAAFGWTNAPFQGPALPPTSDQQASSGNGDLSNEFAPRTMRNSEYFNLEYPVNSNCTDATGTCLCGSDCRCLGCLTHQGHVELPN